jgi:hypothetical protein
LIVGLGAPDKLLIWDVRAENRHSFWQAHKEPVTALAIDPAGKRAVTGALNGEIAVWDLATAEAVFRSKHAGDRINAIEISSDGRKFVAVDEGGLLTVHDMETGEQQNTYIEDGAALTGVALADRGAVTVIQTARGAIRFLDTETTSDLFSILLKTNREGGFAAGGDGRYILSWDRDRLGVLDAFNRQGILEMPVAGGAAAITSNGRFLLVGEGQSISQVSLDACADERAILLDPCRDRPEDFLVYDENGLVASVRPSAGSFESGPITTGESDRGQVTIDTYGLNRTDLVERRRAAATALRLTVENLAPGFSTDDPFLQKELAALTGAESAFAAMNRQLLPRFLESRTERPQPTQAPQDWYQKNIGQHAVDQKITTEAFDNLGKYAAERETGCVEGATDTFEPLQISRVEIQNFKCIEDLTFDIAGGTADRAGWRVLLGENGVGKSSALAAIALAVMGQDQLDRLTGLDQKKLLRRGAREGCVKVHFATDLEPVEIRLTPDGIDRVSRVTPRTYLLGFGSARWLPRPGSQDPETGACVRVRNMFNPFVPLTDALAWLEKQKRTLHYTRFRSIEEVLVRLLLLEPGTRIKLSDDVLYVVPPKKKFSPSTADRLDQFSDGYQTILAIAVAILEMLGPKWNYEMEPADGLVLLDEIGAHLHPRWKLRIVDSLRSAFPRMQFIATTHEPLCLRGLGDGEVAVLKKSSAGKIYAVTDLPSVSGMQVEQLLTSEHFGLASTIDPELEGAFERYYELLRLKRISGTEKGELEELRKFLARRRVLGTTRRERLMLDAIDRSLARAETGPAQREDSLSALTDELAVLIDQVDV